MRDVITDCTIGRGQPIKHDEPKPPYEDLDGGHKPPPPPPDPASEV